MSEHPPPAPDWILGEDGHWRPPPFDPIGAAGPVGAAPGGPPPGGATMPPGAAWPPPGAPGWGPPLPPSGSSAGRTAAIVLGVLGVGFVAFIGLLIGAVTFLGTSSEQRFERIDAPPLTRPTTPSGDPDISEVVSGSEIAMAAIATDLTDRGWMVRGDDALAVTDAETPGACTADGWLTGAVDRHRAYFGRPPHDGTDALTVSLTAYADADAAAAERERARSQAYQHCEVVQHQAEFSTSATPTVTMLPDDPQAPGVAYEITESGATMRTEHDITVVVGEVRAHLDFCGCADLELEGQREVARWVAAVLASEQGLPTPG